MVDNFYTEEELLFHKLSYDSYDETKQKYFDYIFKNLELKKICNCILTPFELLGKDTIYGVDFHGLTTNIQVYNINKGINNINLYNHKKTIKLSYKPNKDKIISCYVDNFIVIPTIVNFKPLYFYMLMNLKLFYNKKDVIKYVNYILEKSL